MGPFFFSHMAINAMFFLVSLIALSAIQFSKYLPLSSESLLYGQVFPGTRGSVLSAANPRAYWGVGGLFTRGLGAERGSRTGRAGISPSPSPQARSGSSSWVEPGLRISRQVHGDEARLGHHVDPEPQQPDLPERGGSQRLYVKCAELLISGGV